MAKVSSRKKWSYAASERLGFTRRLEELWNLYQSTRDPKPAVERYLTLFETMRADIRARTGRDLASCAALEIGPGQKLGLMRCLSRDNRPTGIDMDIVVQDLSLFDYAQMLRYNSLLRVIKTMGRKALGLDSAFERLLAARMGMERFPKLPIYRMDAAKMSFEDRQFDLAYSFSVFEHIDRPEAALREVARVLRPGGVAYVSIHVITSHSGCHIPEQILGDSPTPPYWPWLRPAHREGLRPSAYLNEVTLTEWVRMFAEIMPGAWLIREQQNSLVDPLKELRAQGELLSYSDEELLTVNLIAIWQRGNETDKGDDTIRWVP